jgi:acyl-CoA thioester hydrolase
MTASPGTSVLAPAHVQISTVRIRYAETDPMGFAYHPHYLVWCEIARTDFLRALGTTYAELEKDGLLLAVVEAGIRYAAPARYDDVITVSCALERVQSRSVTFSYTIARVEPGPEQRLATAHTRLMALDRTGEPRVLPPALLGRFRDAIARLS